MITDQKKTTIKKDSEDVASSGRQADLATVIPTQGPFSILGDDDRMENGTWIKLYRKFKDWGWYRNSNMVHLFIHLLLSANYKANDWMGVSVGRGQVVTGLHTLYEDTGISIQTIRTCINRLKSTGEITSKSTNKFSVITIVNYEEYQQQDLESTSKSTSKLTNNQQATNKQLTTLKEVKKEKKYNKPSSLSDDEWMAQLKSNPSYKGIDIDIQRGRCQMWCVTNNKTFSRRRLLNWLNRSEKPITPTSHITKFDNIG